MNEIVISSVYQIVANTIVFLYVFGGPGASHLEPVGTGFVYGHASPALLKDGGGVYSVLITASHVLANQKRVVVRLNSKNQRPLAWVIDLEGLRSAGALLSHQSPDVDIVMIPLPKLFGADFVPIPNGNVASRESIAKYEIGPPDRVYIPSFIFNFTGTGRTYPFFRTGNIGLFPDDDIPLELQLGKTRRVVSDRFILLDARAESAASGSPVFVWQREIGFKHEASRALTNSAMVVGIVHGYYPTWEPVSAVGLKESRSRRRLVSPDETVQQWFRVNTGITVATPAWHIFEILETDRAKKYFEGLDSHSGQALTVDRFMYPYPGDFN